MHHPELTSAVRDKLPKAGLEKALLRSRQNNLVGLFGPPGSVLLGL